MRFKKLSFILSALIATTLFAGCGNSASTDSGKGSNESVSTDSGAIVFEIICRTGIYV